MAKDTLEERVSNSSNSENNLEDIVKNHKPRGFIGKIFDYTIAAGANILSYLAIGNMALIANAIAFVGDRIVNWRRKRDTPSRQTRNSAIMASLMAIPGKIGFDLMNKYINVKTMSGWLTRGVVQLGLFRPAMGLANTAISYPLINRTFKGMYEKGYKKAWWNIYKDGLKYLGIPNMLTARFLPPQTHFPISLGLRTLFRTSVAERVIKIYEDPYRYEYKKINGQSIDELIKKYQTPKTEYKPKSPYQPV